MIGHLQTNKAKDVVGFAREFHALDSIKVAEALNRRLHDTSRELDVFIQVNSSGEPQKFGLPPDQVEPFARDLARFGALRVRGLMTLAVFSDDQDAVAACFERMRTLQGELRRPACPVATTSCRWACPATSSWPSPTARRPSGWARRSSVRAVDGAGAQLGRGCRSGSAVRRRPAVKPSTRPRK